MQLSRPRYGKTLRFAGEDLPKPGRLMVPTRHGVVPCLRYPGTVDARYLHFHGGAFMMRYPLMDDFWARFVVARTGTEVIVPDYSVAPRVRYPVAHEQACDVAARLSGGQPTVVGGFSAGGSLAAAVALNAVEQGISLRGQFLGVPSLDVAEDVSEKAARVQGSMISASLLRLVRATYFKDASRRAEPMASPLYAPTLAGLAPAFVITAERDVLRREGDEYARRLQEEGVPTQHIVAPGVDHYFLHGGGRAQAQALMEQMAHWIRTAVMP